MLKQLLNRLIEGHTLSKQEAIDVMDTIMAGHASPSQIASLLSVLRLRGETVEEMTGFVTSMKSHVIPLDHDEDIMDTCGTGGDGASTFNISTAATIAISSLGVKVAKHGNRAISSKSGSADVLEYLGIPIQLTPEDALLTLKDTNMCFLFAPHYHVSMKYVATPRKELGFRTVFNILGPLANPANSKKQLVGVYDPNLSYRMAETLREVGTDRALFVSGRDGLDEMSISGSTHVVELKDNKITQFDLTPEDVGLVRGNIRDIQVDHVKDSAHMIEKIFNGDANQTATNTVVLNAAAGLYVYGFCDSIKDGVEYAKKAIDDGLAYQQLQKLIDNRRGTRHA